MDEIIGPLGRALAARYRVENEIDRGGMAIVLRARDLRHERWVALKVLRPDLSSSFGAERFLREIRLAAGLHHPHILPVHDSGEADGFLFFVMPFVEGETLRRRLQREGQLPTSDALTIAREVAGALQYAHERDVVHRDIKPENILLSGDHALVADFGIARAITAAGGLSLTEAGLAVGTPAYMSPEQIAGSDRVDGRSDVYALGCVLYEMLAGEPPFRGPGHQVMAQHAATQAPSLRGPRPSVSPAIELAVATAMAKAPADRFPSARAFADALPHPTTTHASVAAPPPSRVRRAVIAAAAAILLLAAGWAGTLIAGRPEETLSIAVAPMRVHQGTASDSIFADALTQELTAALTRVNRIAPRPYTTVLAAAGSAADAVDLGRRVDVEYVLESSMRRTADRLRILSVLIRVDNGTVAWSPHAFEGYDSDLFRMQDSIATQLTRDLAGEFALAAAVEHTPDPEAYKLYLEGRHRYLLSADGSREAIRLYRMAVDRDPRFADAWAALAQAYSYWSQLSGESPGSLHASATEAINRALSLDSLNGEAWVYRATRTWTIEWDFDRADREFARALSVTPNAAWAHIEYAKFLNLMQHKDSAYAELRRALDLDPANPHFLAIRGYLLQSDDRVTEADSVLRRVLAINANDFLAHFMLAKTALRSGRPAIALEHAKTASRITGESPFMLGPLAYYHRKAGRAEEARALVARLETMASQQYVQRSMLALARHGAGDIDGALTDLEASATLREVDFLTAMLEAGAELWSEPRYHALLRRAGLHSRWKRPPVS